MSLTWRWSFLLALAAGTVWGESWEEAARELAAKIGGGEPASVTVRNLSGMAEADMTAFRSALVQALSGKAAGGDVEVTLAESSQGYLLVAQVRRGEETQVAMVTLGTPPSPERKDAGGKFRLERKRVWDQVEAILDAVPAGGGVLVLEPGRIVFHVEGRAVQVVVAASPAPWPRDPRGRLEMNGTFFRAFLPGLTCSGEIQPVFGGECKPAKTAWPLEMKGTELAERRNYFVREKLPPFFSVAGIEEDGRRLWVVAGVDGGVELRDESLETIGTFEGWGGDVASIAPACGKGPLVVATRRGDGSEPDAVEAYEIVNRRPQSASEAVEFGGPITALWPGRDPGAVTAVHRDLTTERYAAVLLGISCDR